MPRFKIILTSDYEVWGDGSGCVERCVIEPTEQILSIAEKYNARVTFFFDVCEYWAFEQIEKKGEFRNDYRPASLMKEQLQDAIRRKHDVQLHFHPQWLNYQFVSNQIWKLDNRYWRLPKIDSYHNSDWNLEKLFSQGKKTLEDLFRNVKPNYQVFAFRAGAWCIQPEEEVVKAMKTASIVLDSTVAQGLSHDDGQTIFNFSKSTANPPTWSFSSDVQVPDDQGELLEVPISTVKVSLFMRLYFLFLKIILRIRSTPDKCTTSNEDGAVSVNGKFKAIKRLFENNYRMLNFSDATSSQEMIYLCKALMSKYEDSDIEEIPLVVISHPKTFGNPEQFERFMSWLSQHEKVSFGTFQELIN